MWRFVESFLLLYPNASIKTNETTISYKEMRNTVLIHGNRLKSTLKPMAKCAILCDSELNAAIALLSCWHSDMVAIPLSKNYGKDHYKKIINLTKPDIIIIDNTENTYDYTYNLEQKCFSGKDKHIKTEPELNNIAAIMCTSGTSGKPKGTMITKCGLQNNIESIAKYFDLKETDTVLISRPIYHCAVLSGEFLVSLFKGANIVFFDNVYNPANVIFSIQKNSATVICGTPTLLNHIARFIKLNNKNTTINKIAISGECLGANEAKNIRNSFPNADIYSVYGLTEASPRVSYLPVSDFDVYPESVGIPIEGVKINIVDIKTGKNLPANTHGNVFVSSPCLMKAYYDDPVLTKKTIVNGWLNTHDIGYKDENGYLYILGRDDNMIIKAGMNIYPKEIENAVNKLPEVLECLAYSIHGTVGEDIIMDIVLLNEYQNISKKDLMKKIHEVLPSYLMPSRINILDALPRNASGKLIRHRRYIGE